MLKSEDKARRRLVQKIQALRSQLAGLEPVEVRAEQAEFMSVEDVLRASDEKYRPLFDNMLNGLAYCRIVLDENGRPVDFIYIDVNNAFERLAGLKKEDVVGKKVTEVMPGIKEAHPELFDIYGEAALTGKEARFEIFLESLQVWLSICVYSPAKSYFVTIFENITEQKHAEEEREVMIKLLSLINSSNHMHEMMRLVTVFLRDWSQCEAVGVRLAEGEDYPYFVTSGFPEEFVQAESSLCSVNEIGEPVRDGQGRMFLECMCGNVISGRYDPSRPFFTRNGSFWTNSTNDLLTSTTEANRLAKSRNRCNAAGYESVALVPLHAGGKTFGLLQFSDKQRGRFTPEKISLFERLADNLAIGLAQRRAEQSLRTSETRLSEAVQIAKLGYWEYDVAKNLFTFNDQFYSVYRTSAEQVGGYKMSPARYAELFLFPEDVPNFHNEIRTVIETTDPNFSNYAEHRVKFGNGETGYVSIRHFLIKDSHGRTIKTHGVNQDITERKRAEEALRASEARYRSYIDVTSDIAWVTDADGNVVEDIPSWRKFTGQSYEEAKGSGWTKALHPDDIERTLAAWRHAVSTKSDYEVEYRMRRYDGEYRCLLARGVPVMDEDGNILEWVGTCIDITERKQAEEALREAEVRYRTVADFTYDWEDWENPDGTFRYVSPSCERITGYAAKRFMDDPGLLSQLILPEDREIWAGHRRDAAETPGLHEVQFRIRRANGEIRWVERICQPVTDQQGAFLGYRGSNRDITERKQVEERLRKYQHQLKSMASQLSKVQEKERRSLAAEMHDRISQRLAMAKVDVQMLAESSGDAEVSGKLRGTAKEIGRVTEDIYSLMLKLSNPVLYEVGLKAAVEALLRDRIRPECGIEYELTADEELKLDDAVRIPVYQAVRELLTNVIKHSRASKLVIDIHKAGDKVQVRVEDNGIGFDAAGTKAPVAGREGGFGLFGIKENLEYINGKLELKSEQGKGTMAIVTVPLENKVQINTGGQRQ